MNSIMNFYKGKRVLVTGHTGFKGSWLCKILTMAGANVCGYAKEPPSSPALFELCQIGEQMHSVIGDIRDLAFLKETIKKEKPEIVFHLAAQPIVLDSYQNPVYTYETNVMGTVNVLESIRTTDSVCSFLNVTTDKVYENKEWEWGYRETDGLNGFDPYSNSKSCSELVTDSYKKSFFSKRSVAISTARAGNVIGGGDFANYRLIPDCVRCAVEHKPIPVRNPLSVRPFQHVLEPLFAYLLIAQRQYQDKSLEDCYNVGPNEGDCVTAGELAELFCRAWGEGQIWENLSLDTPHEANYLKLDCSRIRRKLGWKPVWNICEAVEKTVEWSKIWRNGQDLNKIMEEQIQKYNSVMEEKNNV